MFLLITPHFSKLGNALAASALCRLCKDEQASARAAQPPKPGPWTRGSPDIAAALGAGQVTRESLGSGRWLSQASWGGHVFAFQLRWFKAFCRGRKRGMMDGLMP